MSECSAVVRLQVVHPVPAFFTLTALCDVLLFRDELFYYESFGLFAVLILVQLAATGVAAFHIYQEKKD